MTRSVRPIRAALLVTVAALALSSCSDDPATDTTASEGDSGAAEDAGDDDGSGEASDAMPPLFELGSCDMIPAEELDAAGFEPEPVNTTLDAGDDIGNGCYWEGGPGGTRKAEIKFLLGDLDWDEFDEVENAEDTTVDDLPATHATGKDNYEMGDPISACATRIEVEPGVILELSVGVSQTADYETEDEVTLAAACQLHDQLLPTVTSNIPG